MIKGRRKKFNANINECFELGLRDGIDMPFTNFKPLESFTEIINKLKLPLNVLTCLFQKKTFIGKQRIFSFPKCTFPLYKI